MLKHEKKAFLKFFFTYFGSVAILILVGGFFYFNEKKMELLAKEHFSMIEYARQLKMKMTPDSQTGMSHEIKNIEIDNFSMSNFNIDEKYFTKYIPDKWDSGYLLIKKSKKEYQLKLDDLQYTIISLQIFLLLLFAFISYFLSTKALEPMQEAINKLDNFSKDIIHDLNTPITSILLNMKLLDKKIELKDNKQLNRIKRSVEDIFELHTNLTSLLQEESMVVEYQDISEVIYEVVSTHEKIFMEVHFDVDVKDFFVIVNKKAFKQIITNLISNACKYSSKNPIVRIYTEGKKLFIEDNGVGIKNPDDVFKRSYKEHSSGHGIGLDITQRLCDAMEIKISLSSELNKGTVFILKFI